MNIGYLCSEYPAVRPAHGGIGSFVQTMAQSLVQAGHDATIYAFGDGAPQPPDMGVRVLTVPSGPTPWSSLRRMRSRLSQDLASGTIHVIEAAECEAHCLPMRSPTIVRMHGSHHFWCATLPQPRRYRRLLLEQLAIRQARGLCAVSAYAAEVTRRAMHLGARQIEVLANPVDTSAFVPRTESVVRGRIVFAGSITEKKGVKELCDSMPLIRGRHPDAELLLAGREVPASAGGCSFREDVERQLAPGVREHVRFLGSRSRAEVSELMASAQVCVFPSHMETQGIVIAEAMACGRPVVATRRGPGPEVLGADGHCGWLVDPTDPVDIAEKVCRLLADERAAERCGANGRQRAVSVFGVPAAVGRNLAFYARVAGES